MQCKVLFSLFFTNTSTTDIYTLSLHDALPIFLNQILVEYFKLIETLEASAEHPVQISDFVVIGLKASGIEPVYHQPPPSAITFAKYQGGTAIKELRIFRTTPRLPRLRSHRNGREHDSRNQRAHHVT